MPTLFALFATLLLTAASGRSVQDTDLMMSQHAARLLAAQQAELGLVQAVAMLAETGAESRPGSESEFEAAAGAGWGAKSASQAYGDLDLDLDSYPDSGSDAHADVENHISSDISGQPTIETLPTAADAELSGLPLTLQRVTVTGEWRGVRVRLQADFVVDGCESVDDEDCIPRVRRIAWRQLMPD